MFAPKITFGNWRKHARTAASAEANHMIPFYFPSLSASLLTIRTYELHNDHTTYTIHVVLEQCRRKKKSNRIKLAFDFSNVDLSGRQRLVATSPLYHAHVQSDARVCVNSVENDHFFVLHSHAAAPKIGCMNDVFICHSTHTVQRSHNKY